MANALVTDSWMEILEQDFREIARYDHSVAVPNLGTLFRYDPGTAIGQAQRHLAEIYGVPFAYPMCGSRIALPVAPNGATLGAYAYSREVRARGVRLSEANDHAGAGHALRLLAAARVRGAAACPSVPYPALLQPRRAMHA